MKESIIVDKSKAFALRIIKLYRYLCAEKQEYVLSKQLLRSGTSIGANGLPYFILTVLTDLLKKNCK